MGLIGDGRSRPAGRRLGLRLALLLVVGLLVACGAAPAKATVSPSPALSADAVMSPGTIPAPAFALQDQNGQTVSISGLRGRVVAITFLYSHCKESCPLEGDQLGLVQQALGAGIPFTLVVISVDPGGDTPASVRDFAAAHRWIGDWHWLMGPQATLAPIWSAFGIAVQPQTGNMAHSVALYLIDEAGYERAGFLILDPTNRVVSAIRLLAGSR